MKPGGAAGSASNGGEHYRFDRIEVDVPAHTLSRDTRPQALEPKAFAVLIALLRRPGELLGREELLDEVWGHRHVTPGVLTRAIAQLRSALEDDVQQPRYIQTQHALGYRFIGELQSQSEPQSEPQSVPPLEPPSAAPPPPTAALADAAPVERTEDAGSSIAAQQPVIGVALPYAGDERQGHRSWHWLVFAALMLGLVAWAWLERRGMPVQRMEPSIAVMPFTNLSNDRDNDYFARGLAAEMSDALAGVKGLKVAAQVSPATVLEKGGDVKALGALLGVSTLLDANVRRDGQRVRINARLSDCRTGYILWSHSYDHELSSVFDTQVRIADEVVRSLLDVLPQQQEAIAKRLTPTRNAAAFDAYLRGLAQLLQSDSGSHAVDAIKSFGEALAADKDFSRAQAGICRSEVTAFRERRDAGAFERARTACARAKEMDEGGGEVDVALGDLYQAQGESGKAVEAYTRAESDPASRPAAYMGLAMVHAEQGEHQRALALSQSAMALRPGDARILAYSGYYNYLAGRLPDAIASYRKALELQPDDATYWSTLAALYVVAGSSVEATRALERSIAIEPGYAALTNLGELKYLAGDYATAASLHRRATVLEPADYIPWGNLGNALLADPATASQARTAFQEAADRAQRYIEARPNDGTTLAALGWFLTNLGRADEAREMIRRSEQLKGEQAEIALYNAQTLASLGDLDAARIRMRAALAAGLARNRITSNAVLRSAGLVTAGNTGDTTLPSTPGKS